MLEKIKIALRKNPFVVQTYRKVKGNWPSRAHIKKWYQRQRLERQNRQQGGVPIPKGELIFLVAGTDDAEWFLRSGRYGVQSPRDICSKTAFKWKTFTPSWISVAALAGCCVIGRICAGRKFGEPTTTQNSFNGVRPTSPLVNSRSIS